MVLERVVKISVERNQRFHSLWVTAVIINVMVPTQPLWAVVSMHIIRHLLSASYWHDRLQQRFWTFSHIKQTQENCPRSSSEEALNLGFSCPLQFLCEIKDFMTLAKCIKGWPCHPGKCFCLLCISPCPHGWDQTSAVGARLSLAVSMTTPSAEERMWGQESGFKEINMLPLSFNLCWSAAAWHEGHS